jgi:hypothetical protein
MKKRNTYGSVYFSLQCLPISHDDRSVEVGLQRNKYQKGDLILFWLNERSALISPLTARKRRSDADISQNMAGNGR